MDELRNEIELNKRLASLQREVAIDTKRIAIDEMSHAARWVMASVLAINSGGLIAAISKVDTLELSGVGAVVAFYVGVMIALVMGWSQVSRNQRLLPIHSKMIVFWETASLDGELSDIKKLEEIRDELIFEAQKGYFSSSLGRWSFVFFSLGLLRLAFSAASSRTEGEKGIKQAVLSSDR
jgi:hypothetical protein